MRHGKNDRNDVGVKEENAEGGGMNTQGPEHYPLVPNQYKKGGHTVKGLKWCGLVVWVKRVYFRVFAKFFFGKKCLVRMELHSKDSSKGLGPPDACHRSR